ncbi:MAG: glycosyltransferase family 2 protein [Saprospiraceae bacterium]|nr:glycosyltransferase family 2 protein [Saprospiraceae bacterium]
MAADVTLTLVIPLYNEEVNIQKLFERCTSALTAWTEAYEIICINDGSSDKTLELLKSIHKLDSRWKVISLSRNFGHQQAFLCGLSRATGHLVAMMDGDLQDPPELLKKFYETMQESDCDVVYGSRSKRKESAFKKLMYQSYYRILKKMANIEIPLDSGDFCLMKKEVAFNLVATREQSLFIRGIRSWLGYKQVGYVYERDARFGGEPKYTFKKLFQLAYNGIFSFSQMPVKLLTSLGFWVVLISVFYSVYALYIKITSPNVPQGFTTLAIAIFFFGGVQLIALGIIGEYVLRIYDETRNRPLFIEKEVLW